MTDKRYWKEAFVGAVGHLHKGDPGLVFETAAAHRKFIEDFGFPPFGRVLDYGSGNGRLAVAYVDAPGLEYFGVEPMAQCVETCKRAFTPLKDKLSSQFHFTHIDLQNDAYNPHGSIKPEDVRLPFKSGFFDWVCAMSVFTHLSSEEVAKKTFEEIFRVTRPGGVIYTTWFRNPPNEITTNPARTVYSEHFIVNLLDKLEWLGTTGNPNGMTTELHDQWHIVGRKK